MKRKKAIIVTWCMTSLNYGEMLQAFAMKCILDKFHIDSTVISYLPESCRKKLKKETIYKENILGYIKFLRFSGNYIGKVIQCKNRYEVEKKAQDCDIYVCGSDQIWNPNYYEHDNIYTLGFGKNEVKRVAYAPSIAIERVLGSNKNRLNYMVESIRNIDYVSVREKRAREILNTYIDKEINVVLDPTLLVPRKKWEQLAKGKCKYRNYMFVYMLGDISKYEHMINYIASKYQVEKIVWLDLIKGSKLKGKNIKRINAVSPNEFLQYVCNAAVVVTDSFHGTMFSIKFKTEFWIFDRKYEKRNMDGDTRLSDILERLQLTGRRISLNETIDTDEKIDYQKVEEILKKERKNSIDFLKRAFNEKV